MSFLISARQAFLYAPLDKRRFGFQILPMSNCDSNVRLNILVAKEKKSHLSEANPNVRLDLSIHFCFRVCVVNYGRGHFDAWIVLLHHLERVAELYGGNSHMNCGSKYDDFQRLVVFGPFSLQRVSVSTLWGSAKEVSRIA